METIKTLFSIIKQNIKLHFCVPYRCRNCELLGLCRDEDNGYRCGKRGCLILWQSERNKITKKEFKEQVRIARWKAREKR